MKNNSSSWHVEMKCPRWRGIRAETGGVVSLTLAQRKVHNKAEKRRFDFHNFTLDGYCSLLFTLCPDILAPVFSTNNAINTSKAKMLVVVLLYCKNALLLYKNPNFYNLLQADMLASIRSICCFKALQTQYTGNATWEQSLLFLM